MPSGQGHTRERSLGGFNMAEAIIRRDYPITGRLCLGLGLRLVQLLYQSLYHAYTTCLSTTKSSWASHGAGSNCALPIVLTRAVPPDLHSHPHPALCCTHDLSPSVSGPWQWRSPCLDEWTSTATTARYVLSDPMLYFVRFRSRTQICRVEG